MSKGCRLEETCSNNRRWDPRGVHRNGFKPVHESGDPVLWGFSPGPVSGDLKTTGVQLALRKDHTTAVQDGVLDSGGDGLGLDEGLGLVGLERVVPLSGTGVLHHPAQVAKLGGAWSPDLCVRESHRSSISTGIERTSRAGLVPRGACLSTNTKSSSTPLRFGGNGGVEKCKQKCFKGDYSS